MAHILPMLEEDFLWSEFERILREYNNEYVLQLAHALSSLRAISPDTSDDVVRESIRDLGINLPNEMLDLNLSKLREFFYHLPNFEENLGNPNYQYFISFLLDGNFEVVPLWTADFKTFAEEPQGTLLEDGGSWYKTSHVKILPQWGKLEKAFDLTIDPELESRLKADKVLSSTDNVVGKDAKDLGDLVLQAVLEFKVIDLFYRFAPIELVLERLIYTVRATGGLFLSGHAGYIEKDYVDYSAPNLTKVVFPRPKKVYANKTVQLFGTAYYDNNTMKQVPLTIEFIEGKEYVQEETPNSIIFSDPKESVPLKLKFRSLDRSSEHVTVLMPSSSAPSPRSISIRIKDTISENKQYPLRVMGMFDELRLLDDPDQVEWTVNTRNAFVEDSILYVGRIHEDEEFKLTAEYWDQNNKYHVFEKTIKIVDSLKESIPLSLEILGSDNITQGNTGSLSCRVHYSDETFHEVAPLWECKNPNASVSPTGILTCEKVQADFKFNVRASLTVEGVTLTTEKLISSIYERLVIFKAEIVGQDEMLESSGQQLYCNASWCYVEDLTEYQLGRKTEEQIVRARTEVDAQWAIGNASTSNAKVEAGYVSTSPTNNTGSLIVVANITQYSASPVSTSKFIRVKPKEDLLSHIDLICSPDIHQGNVYNVLVSGVFESGRNVDLGIDANASVTMDITSEDDSQEDRANLYIIDSKIYYTGDVKGLATLSCVVTYDHTLADGGKFNQVLDQTKLLSIIPKVVRTDSIKTVAPTTNVLEDGSWFVEEESRLFLQTFVTYEDNSIKAVSPNWVNELVVPDTSSEQSPIELVNMEISLRDMVKVLTGYSAEEAYMIAARHVYGHNNSRIEGNALVWEDSADVTRSVNLNEVTDWSILINLDELAGYTDFKSVTNQAELEAVSHRTLVQCGRVLEDTEVVLKTLYYKEECENEILITDRPYVNPDKVLNSSVRGPREFLANVASTSFALYVDYDDGGQEYAVSNDWSLVVLNKREVLTELGWEVPESDEELNKQYPDNLIMDIDQDGYVYPKENATIRFEVTAHYDDSYDTFTKTMQSVAYRANLDLHGIEIIGFDTVLDAGDPNLVQEGVPHFQYIARVQFKDGTVEDVQAEWSFRLDPSQETTDPDGVTIDPSTGKFYVEQQILDQHIILEARFEKEYDTHAEEVKAQLPVQIIATQAITSIEIFGPASTIDDSVVQLSVTATRRDGSKIDVTQLCDWYLLDASEDTTLEDGRIVLGKFASDKQVYVGAKLDQSISSFEDSFDFSVTGQSSLNGLSISGLDYIRDDSVIQLEAIVFRGTEPTQTFNNDADCGIHECVTSTCSWEVIQGSDICSVSDQGILSVGNSTTNKVVEVQATYTEKGETVSSTLKIQVNSSMPRYGVGPFGLTVLDLLDYETVDSPTKGGSFAINVESQDSSNVFGYFCHRKDLGTAYIVESKGRLGYGGWQGAGWGDTHHNYSTAEELQDIINSLGDDPVEFDVQYGNVTTTYLLYRTNKNNFGVGEFAYYYTNQNS